MENENFDTSEVCGILNEIMEYELSGVVRYTHSSLMVTGPHRLPIVDFLKEQASESLQHAQQAGELLTGLDGHPSQKIANIVEGGLTPNLSIAILSMPSPNPECGTDPNFLKSRYHQSSFSSIFISFI